MELIRTMVLVVLMAKEVLTNPLVALKIRHNIIVDLSLFLVQIVIRAFRNNYTNKYYDKIQGDFIENQQNDSP